MTQSSPLPAAVLEAAAALVAERGADGFTMDDLAERTGLSRATLYRKVGSREAVLEALAAQGQDVGERPDTRDRILDAALEVFARVGLEASTIEVIAAEAGVGTATIYRHFGDRDGLVQAFIDERSPRRSAREAAAALTGDLREDLTRVAEALLRGFRERPQIARVILLESIRGGPWVDRFRVASPARTLPTVAAILTPHVREGRLRPGDPYRYAQAFAGMVMGFGLVGPVLNHAPVPDPEETARFITDLFLRGATPEETP